MKKIFIIITLFILVGILGGVGYAQNVKTRPISPVAKEINSVQTQNKNQKQKIGFPQKLVIDKIHVSAQIEHVGLDSKKRMDVPKDVMNVAWYNLGPKPGEVGNAAIDGHVDTQTGAPAVFYNLKKLKKGDSIKVTDQNGNVYTYAVTEITEYLTNEFPIQEVFGPTDKTRLNLITCSGTWDKAKRDYSERTVVYSELTF